MHTRLHSALLPPRAAMRQSPLVPHGLLPAAPAGCQPSNRSARLPPAASCCCAAASALASLWQSCRASCSRRCRRRSSATSPAFMAA